MVRTMATDSTYTLAREQWLPRPLEEVFAYFSDPANLQAITPKAMRFQITTPGPIKMRAGATIDYRVRVRGLPLRWRTLITAYEPPHRFVDKQTRGPYAVWIHTHSFSRQTRNGLDGTLVEDHVRYALPRWLPGPFSRLVHRVLVAPDLDRIFAYRQRVLEERFPKTNTAAS